MSRVLWLSILGLAGLLAMSPAECAQAGPYIAYVYPAGGQQGTTFQVKVGGQGFNGVDDAMVAGTGVSAKVVGYHPLLFGEQLAWLKLQLQELKGGTRRGTVTASAKTAPNLAETVAGSDEATREMIARIEKRIAEDVRQPASKAMSTIAIIEVTIAPNAKPGQRELRLVTPRGVSNPLVFQVGQLPEYSRKPMITSQLQVLGKEERALRKRPPEEVEDRIMVPCTANGQIASGEVNPRPARANAW